MALIHVAAAAIVEGSKVLVARRLPGGMHGGLWEFPGGKVEEGESPRQALERELMEELGISARAGEWLTEIVWHYPERSILLDVYFCEILAGTPEPIACSDVAWVEASEMRLLKMPDADAPVVEALCSLLDRPATI